MKKPQPKKVIRSVKKNVKKQEVEKKPIKRAKNKVEVKKQDLKKEDKDLLAIILAVFLPPVGVLIKEGLNIQVLINVILTICGYIPGVIHALYVILRKK